MAKIESQIPVSGVGFVTNNRTDNSHFATQTVHDLLIKLAGLWHELHPERLISIGQISHKGGGLFKPHAQHKNGVEADARLFRKDGKNLPCTIDDPQYDRELTREFVKFVRANANMHRIFLNDPVLLNEGTSNPAMKGHRDHMHLWFEVTQEGTARVLQNGDVSDNVKRLQEALIAAGFPIEGGADRNFGKHTEDAVRAFQTAHPPLPANGIADDATLKALGL